MHRALPLLLLAAAGPGGGGAVERPHVTAELVAEDLHVRRGGTVLVGVHLRLDPHWHVYWRNPGDSGMPVEIRWDLPAGWKAGPLRWPAPRRLPVGPLMNFGYGGEVLLAAEILVPAEAEEGPATLGAKASWLVCEEICEPGDARVETVLAVRAAPAAKDPARAALFERTRAAWPRELPKGAVRAERRGENAALLLAVDGKRLGGEPRPWFFPGDEGILDNAADQPLAREGDRWRLLLAFSDPEDGPPERLRGVVVVETAEGPRAFDVDVPVEAPSVKAGDGGREKR